jgi:hypothetical protein
LANIIKLEENEKTYLSVKSNVNSKFLRVSPFKMNSVFVLKLGAVRLSVKLLTHFQEAKPSSLRQQKQALFKEYNSLCFYNFKF